MVLHRRDVDARALSYGRAVRARVRKVFIVVALLELLWLLITSWHAHWHLWYLAAPAVVLTYGLLELWGISIERAQWTQVPDSWQASRNGERSAPGNAVVKLARPRTTQPVWQHLAGWPSVAAALLCMLAVMHHHGPPIVLWVFAAVFAVLGVALLVWAQYRYNKASRRASPN